MDIKENKISDSVLELAVTVTPDDYMPWYNQELKKARKNISMPGFRKGMVPQSVVEKKYGKALLDEIMRREPAQIMYRHLDENKIKVLGQPYLDTVEPANAWSTLDAPYVFTFSVGLMPELDLNVEGASLPWKKVTISSEEVEEALKSLADRHAEPQEVEKIGRTDKGTLFLSATQKEVSEGAEPIALPEARLDLFYVRNESLQGALAGKAKGDTFTYTPAEIFAEDRYAMAHFLGVDKSDLENKGLADREFDFTVVRLEERIAPEVNEEFAKKFSTEAKPINSLDDLRAEIRLGMEADREELSFKLFSYDVFAYLQEKNQGKELPLKHMALSVLSREENYTEEELQTRINIYKSMQDRLVGQVAFNAIAEELGIDIQEADLKGAYVNYFRQNYGIGDPNVIESMIAQYGIPEKLREQLTQEVFTAKSLRAIKEKADLKVEEVTVDEAVKELQAANKADEEGEEEVGTYADDANQDTPAAE